MVWIVELACLWAKTYYIFFMGRKVVALEEGQRDQCSRDSLGSFVAKIIEVGIFLYLTRLSRECLIQVFTYRNQK